MCSLLEGLPFPEILLLALLRRIKAEREISYPHAKLINSVLNRKARFANSHKEMFLTVSLDPANAKIGYRLGRRFAVLERIQEMTNPGLNATIRDKFYVAFGNLVCLAPQRPKEDPQRIAPFIRTNLLAKAPTA